MSASVIVGWRSAGGVSGVLRRGGLGIRDWKEEGRFAVVDHAGKV